MEFYPPHFELPKKTQQKLADKFCIAGSGQLRQPDSLYRVLADSRRLQVLFYCCKIKKNHYNYTISIHLSIYLAIYRFKVHVFAKVCLYSVQLLRITPNIILFSFIVAHFSTKCLGSNTMWTEYKN